VQVAGNLMGDLSADESGAAKYQDRFVDGRNRFSFLVSRFPFGVSRSRGPL